MRHIVRDRHQDYGIPAAFANEVIEHAANVELGVGFNQGTDFQNSSFRYLDFALYALCKAVVCMVRDYEIHSGLRAYKSPQSRLPSISIASAIEIQSLTQYVLSAAKR